MNLVIEKELPRPCNMLILHASGCFGDGGEMFNESEQFVDDAAGRAKATAMARMYARLEQGLGPDMESVDDMGEWLLDQKIDSAEFSIPCDCSDMLPSIEKVNVLLYDKDGRTFKMKLGY